MSGGFFRGTSADQDTRFSNKTAKLLKTQKFAPELDQLIDMSKIKMDTLRPWIATRVTQFLGFEDEVLINFIYELLEGKNVDGKQIQIQLTGFMEKNTGKFMKELWGLLTSAQNTASGIPQQLLDEKAEEARQKKAEEHRIISEVRRKEDEKRTLEQEVFKKEVSPVEVEKVASSTAPKPRSNSLSRGGKSPDGDRRNGTMDSRRPPSRSRSGSHISSKSVSRSPRPASKRRMSRSVSRSPPRRFRRSRSPLRRGRSSNYAHRSRSPLRRAWSPINTRSPRRRRRSYSRSPRGRSPIAAAHSPRRRRSPQLSYSPRGRSPNVYSPRRRRSPVFTRSSPRRRKSPPRSPPRYRRRSPRYDHSPVRRNTSPPARRRHTAVSPQRHTDSSPRRRPHILSPRRGSPSPRRVTRSSSREAFSKSPQRRDSSGSPQRHTSTSPPLRPIRKSSPSRRNTNSVASPQQNIPPSKGRLSKGSMSPVQQRKLPTYQLHSSRSPSPAVHTVKPVSKAAESPPRGTRRAAPLQCRRLSPSLSPRIQQRSPGLSEASPPKERRSPLASSRGLMGEGPVKTGQRTQKNSERMPVLKKRRRSSSRESSLPDEDMEDAPLKKFSISNANAGVSSSVNRQSGKVDEAIGSVSKSSSDDQHPSPGGKWRNTKDMDSDGNEDNGTVGLDDRKTAKRRRKEERRLRKEEKRRKREERHKRKEEKRANKFLSKGIASVTPPPDFDKRTIRSDDFDSPDEGKGEGEDMEIEQVKLENELRRKALDSIKARKVVSS